MLCLLVWYNVIYDKHKLTQQIIFYLTLISGTDDDWSIYENQKLIARLMSFMLVQ